MSAHRTGRTAGVMPLPECVLLSFCTSSGLLVAEIVIDERFRHGHQRITERESRGMATATRVNVPCHGRAR